MPDTMTVTEVQSGIAMLHSRKWQCLSPGCGWEGGENDCQAKVIYGRNGSLFVAYSCPRCTSRRLKQNRNGR